MKMTCHQQRLHQRHIWLRREEGIVLSSRGPQKNTKSETTGKNTLHLIFLCCRRGGSYTRSCKSSIKRFGQSTPDMQVVNSGNTGAADDDAGNNSSRSMRRSRKSKIPALIRHST